MPDSPLVPNGWKLTTIDNIKAPERGAIAIGPFGSRLRSSEYTTEGVPMIRGNNISSGRGFDGEFAFVGQEKAKELQSSIVVADDLVFPHRGAIGTVGIVRHSATDKWILSTSLMKLT